MSEYKDYFNTTGSYAEIIAYLREMNQVEMADAVLGMIRDLAQKDGIIETLRIERRGYTTPPQY